MITAFRHVNHYCTETRTPYNVWKSQGEWYTCPSSECIIKWSVGFSKYHIVGGTNTVGPFSTKKAAFACIETLSGGQPNWQGMSKIKSKINKEHYQTKIVNDSGHAVEYWEKYMHDMCNKVLLWAHSKYSLRPTCNPEIKISFAGSWKARRSAAFGFNKVIFRPFWYLTKSPTRQHFWYNEYRHITNDPDIGEFNTNDPHKTVLALILHEIAHSVHDGLVAQIQTVKSHAPVTKKEKHGHGSVWQTIYMEMRKEFLPEATNMNSNIEQRFI
jgi:hypothetical protein